MATAPRRSGLRPRLVRAAWSLGAVLALASPGNAGCRLALVLALDVSSSVDAQEHMLQREGLARALVDPEVVGLFLSDEPVAVYVFEWASPSMQKPLLPGWELVESAEDLARISATLLTEPRTRADERSLTGIGAALIHASSALSEVSECPVHKVDVSGDGMNNVGFGPRYVYATYPFEGVTVNALVIDDAVSGGNNQLTYWFRSNVLHGSDAFWIAIRSYEDFQRAMTAKLLRELETPVIGGDAKRGSAG